MELEEYLKAIESCPDEIINLPDPLMGKDERCHRLTVEYGVYDNFEIMLRIQRPIVENFLRQSSNYIFYGKGDESRDSTDWGLKIGTVILSVSDRSRELEAEKINKEMGDIKTGLSIHPYQVEDFKGKEAEGISWQKAISLVVLDIGKWALEKRIPLYIPHSVGWRYLSEKNYQSRAIRFNPK